MICLFNDTATTAIYTLPLPDALPISQGRLDPHHRLGKPATPVRGRLADRTGPCTHPDNPDNPEQPKETTMAITTHTPADRKSTRLNSSHANISYAVFCLKKKNHQHIS